MHLLFPLILLANTMAADKEAFIIYFNKEVHLHTQMYKMHPFFHYVKCLPAISFQDFTYGIIIPETPLPYFDS